MVLYKDIFDDSVKVKVKHEYFYVMMNKDTNDTPVPDYVFPDFEKFYNMMHLITIVEPGNWKLGKIEVKGDAFSARLPYLKNFLNRQEESLKDFEKTFENEKLPTDRFSKRELYEIELKLFNGL